MRVFKQASPIEVLVLVIGTCMSDCVKMRVGEENSH